MAWPVQGSWRVLLCDKYGEAISDVTTIATEKVYTAALNAPASFSFTVPANDPRVSGLNLQGSLDNIGDGEPFLADHRTVRAYRYETQTDGSVKWVIRFAGHVWAIEDEGDGENLRSHVAALDPFAMLQHRVARRMIWLNTGAGAGANIFYPYWYFDDPYHWRFPLYDNSADSGAGDPATGGHGGSAIVSKPGTDIARGLLNATNYYDGFTGLDDYYLNVHMNLGYKYPGGGATNFHTGYDTRPPTSPSRSPVYDNSIVGDSIVTLANQANTFDFEVVPTDAYYCQLGPIGDAPQYRTSAGGPRIASLKGIPVASHFPYTPPLGQPGSERKMQQVQGKAAVSTSPLIQTLGLLKFYAPSRGSNLEGSVVFAFAVAPHSLATLSRTLDMQGLISFARTLGNKRGAGEAINARSINRYNRVYMGLPTQINTKRHDTLVNDAQETVNALGVAQQTIAVSPASGGPTTPRAFDHFNLGDYVRVAAGSGLRGGLSLACRVVGFTLTIDDSSGELLTDLVINNPGTPT